MRLLKRRQTTKPKHGMAAAIHIALIAILPVLIYILIRLEFVGFAFAVVLLSKWRMLAVKFRHWPANIRANAVDIFFGLSMVVFISLSSSSQAMQVGWTVAYIVWLLFVKPRSSVLWIGLQALLAQTASLIAVFLLWSDVSMTALVFAIWGVTYLCARHFLAPYDERMARATAHAWAFFCASLTWLASHWLLYYGPVSQPALIITVIGYGLGAMYYLEHTERLKAGVRRQFIILMVAVLLFIVVFSDWSGDII